MEDDSCTIRIEFDLYTELRDYCDRNGIRFVDFVADSLEKATHLHEVENLLCEENKVNERIAREGRRAFLHGFSQGVMAATLALKGDLSLSEMNTPVEARDLVVPREVKGGQMKLFDE